jgi:hypothetical protein
LFLLEGNILNLRPMALDVKFLRESRQSFSTHLFSAKALSYRARLSGVCRVRPRPVKTTYAIACARLPGPGTSRLPASSLFLNLQSASLNSYYQRHTSHCTTKYCLSRGECQYTGEQSNTTRRRNLNNHLLHHNGLQCLRRGAARAGPCTRRRHRGRARIGTDTTPLARVITRSHRSKPTNTRTQRIRSLARSEQPRWRQRQRLATEMA